MRDIFRILLSLAPLAWLICNGPLTRYVLFLGGLIAIFERGPKRVIIKLQNYSAFLILGFTYLLASFVTHAPEETFEYKELLLLFWYAIPLGMSLAKGQSKYVLAALAIFSVALAGASETVVSAAGVDRIIRMANEAAQLSRTNVEEVTFLRIFSLENVIIGIVPMTLFALSAIPVLFGPAKLAIKAVILFGVFIALHVNWIVLTRTTISAAGVAVVITSLLFFQREAKRGVHGWVLIVAGIAIAAIVTLAVVGFSAEGNALMERFYAVDEDPRVDLWAEGISLLLRYPTGHGSEHLSLHTWSHNVFLDVGLTSGWAGFISVVLLHIMIVIWWCRALQGRDAIRRPDVMMLFSTSLGVFIASQIHPPQLAFFIILVAAGVFAREVEPVLSSRAAGGKRKKLFRRIRSFGKRQQTGGKAVTSGQALSNLNHC